MNDEIICTIRIGNFVFDDDYTFYKDGRIKRFYDQNQFKHSIEEWVTANKISEIKKEKILINCEEGFKEEINRILTN